MTNGSIRRRDLLKVGICLPLLSAGAPSKAPGAANGRTLVVVELVGGNDGLNTVVPLRSAAYAKARSRVGIRADVHEDRPPRESRQNDGDAGPLHALEEQPTPETRGDDAAGVARADDRIDFTGGHQLPADGD